MHKSGIKRPFMSFDFEFDEIGVGWNRGGQ